MLSNEEHDDQQSEAEAATKPDEAAADEAAATAATSPTTTPSEYTADELDRLVRLVQRLTRLAKLRTDDWSQATTVNATIRSWLLDTDSLILCAFYDGQQLSVCQDFPLAPVDDLTYFLRQPGERFRADTFNDRITFGTVHADIDGTMLAVLERAFAPIFFGHTAGQLSDNVRDRFSGELHSFLAYLTGMHYQMSGCTVLYMPGEALVGRRTPEAAAAERGLVQRLEAVAVHWVGSIRKCLGDREQLVPFELQCPGDQYDYHVYRLEVLRGLQQQMQHCDYLRIVRILSAAQSIFVKQLADLGAQIDAELERLDDTCGYLQLLVQPCADLKRLASAAEVPPRLKEIMHVMRVIWTTAKHFNTRDQMTLLFRCLSNEIILFCRGRIDVTAILAGKPREGLRIANLTIDCLLAYRLIYDYVKGFHVNAGHPIGWDLDEAAIFNHVDTFRQRLDELLEFCNGIIVFGRTDETETIPAPLFGGNRGPEFEATARRTEEMFGRGLVAVQNASGHLLDVHSVEWAQVSADYRRLVRQLEEIIENLMTNVFVTVANVEEGLEALWALYYYSKRANLRPAYLRKTADVWQMFADEMDTTNRQLLEQVGMRRVWQPALAGRVSSLRLNVDRLCRLRDLFVRAEWLPDSSRAAPTLAAFADMEQSLTRTARELYEQWLDAVETDCTGRLNRTLMRRSVRKPGQLECNMDFTVLDLCEEARYFEMMGFGVPGHIRAIYSKYDTLKVVFDSVVSVVNEYNRILEALSPDERKLFAALVAQSDRRVKPGLHQLTWASDQIDAYVADCVKQSRQLQAFVDEYKAANEAMVTACERICDTTLIRLGGREPKGQRDGAVELEQLRAEVEQERQRATGELVRLYGDVVDMMTVVYQGFESQMEHMLGEWELYVRRIDMMLQEAFKLCARHTIHSVYETLHGGGGNIGPAPLLCVNIDLSSAGKIVFAPSISEIASYLGGLGDAIIDAIRRIPRLTDKFQLRRGGAEQPPPVAEFHAVCADDHEFDRGKHLVLDEIMHNQLQLLEYVSVWTAFKALWEVDRSVFFGQFGTASAAAYDTNIVTYAETALQLSGQEASATVYFVEVNATKLMASIQRHIDGWTDGYKQLLKANAYAELDGIYEYTRGRGKELLRVPQTIVEMQQALELQAKVLAELDGKHEHFPNVKRYFMVLDKYEVVISSSYRKMHADLDVQWQWFLDCIQEAEEMLDNCKDTFKLNLLGEAQQIKEASGKLLEQLKELPTTQETDPNEALAAIAAMRAQLRALYDQEARAQAELAIFNINLPDNRDLRRLELELDTLTEVWQLALHWSEAWQRFKSESFWDIVTDDMDDVATGLLGRLVVLTKQLKDRRWDVLERTRAAVDDFRKTLPLLVALKNHAMRARHWEHVRALCAADFDEGSADFNLEAIVRLQFSRHADEITDVSHVATMELQMEQSLQNIRTVWSHMAIGMQPYTRPGVYRLAGVDECLLALEEHAVQISAMKATRFVEPFQAEVDQWEKTLNYMTETLDNGLQVQRQWQYLESIFAGDDIRQQMVSETAAFEELTGEWTDITANMFRAGTAVEATHYRPPNYLLNKLLQMSERMEAIELALELYLETKRQLFPRFYFISNDDMLSILGNAKKPLAVQPNMRKLFDNLYKLKLKRSAAGKVLKWETDGMFAHDGEYVAFDNVLLIGGPAERWLAQVEAAMRQTLKQQLRLARKSLKTMLTKRDRWLSQWPGQLCLTSSKIQWTSDCTRTLTICRLVGQKVPLKKLRRKQNAVLAKLSEQSRRELSQQMRLKVNTLITIEIHGRDVIDKMYKMKCIDVNHFEWFSQLRFAWDREHDDCSIRQTNTCNWYQYEYTGNSGRLVITPLTDRCYMTLTTALHLFRGGSPKGPAGTGKTETVKDLGKALGMWVIVNNCSDTMDYRSMAKCFSGLAQTGAWGCFDEFNRINIEVLSVVSQQIALILAALAQHKKRFRFEGSDIVLRPTVGLFITMNPGYAGRTELPDNLTSMFRPIAMMVPDNIIIAENLLFSDGFVQAKRLAKKVFTLYELAKQQLSRQPHYDFGLRSMVALLRYAGRQRRQFAGEPEERIVYLAMRDMNVAKLTADDGPLFDGIVSDIFPGCTVPTVDYAEFRTCLVESFREAGLQAIPAAVRKAIQLYETKNSRHSVMLLGDTGTAKSTTWQMLKHAFGRMRALAIAPEWVDVIEYPVNPKSLNGAELYGEYNLATGEWTDGVLSSIMRRVCTDESPEQKWLLFDGPVDAVWIENMNSVMDDNRMLTLVNSERITMPQQVSLLFEVADLAQASPATVSRCGMVYNDYKDWGWWPFVDSWLEQQRSEVYRTMLRNLFDEYFDKVLTYKRLHCVETVPTNELNCVQSFVRLMNCLASRENGIDADRIVAGEEGADQQIADLQQMTKLWFMFSMIWSICATVDETGRTRMDLYVRELDSMFPLKDTIYDYCVDVKRRTLAAWEEQLSDNWRFDREMPYYKIVVPTVDTIRYDYLVAKLIAHDYPVLLTGPVGTGKSSTATAVLARLDPQLYALLALNLSAQTSPHNVQEAIEARTEKRTKTLYVPFGGRRLVCFLDDMNMPARDAYGSQCALELIRQWIDYRFWYDRQKQGRIYVQPMQLLAAMGPAGGGRQVVSARTVARFSCINMPFPGAATITRIFGTLLRQQLADFQPDIDQLAAPLTAATINLYATVAQRMLPTPSKMHYLFNLRDISRVFQGLLRSSPAYHVTRPLMLRLWIHECFRVFSDRLTDARDRDWFKEALNDQLAGQLELTLHSLCPAKESPVFGDFVGDAGHYEDLADEAALRAWMQATLSERNAAAGVVPMDLVLFREAIEHTTRIVRVISQPRGHLLLVGIGGSGRQSLCRLAAYIVGQTVFTVEISKRYGVPEFRADLRQLYKMLGVQNRPTVFMISDAQICDEHFMVVLNDMLSVGEVANLYKPDEFDEIKQALEHAASRAKVPPTTEAIAAFFMERARANLHICVCMSPIGGEFRARVREYPALVNCTTIDWFGEWPAVALLEVANRFLGGCVLNMPIEGQQVAAEAGPTAQAEERLRQAVAATFALIHTSVAQMSRTMLAELRRHTYVTPTNYLELVAGYQLMLAEKRATISGAANKLRNGLFKIEDTRIKVEGLSDELKISQEQVIIFQAECDQFIVQIQRETDDADIAKKNVGVQSDRIAVEEADVTVMAASANKDLEKAMPALDAAMLALQSLNKKDLTEVKSYAKPPLKVEKVMEAVMILLGHAPTWTEAKRLLGEQNFLDQLREFDKNHVSEKTLRRIVNYTHDTELEPDKVGAVSAACKSLVQWVRAIEKYARIYKVVGPKIELVDELEAKLRHKQEQLAEARRTLAELERKLDALRAEFAEKTAQKEALRVRAEQLRLNLERAVMLVDGLAGERLRWIDTVKRLDGEFGRLSGDCLMATAFVAYLGPFVSVYRERLTVGWQKEITGRQIPATGEFSVQTFLADPATVREWTRCGLPADEFSTENGIIVTTARRWPLIIDPQAQAQRWIKRMEADNNLQTIDSGQRDCAAVLERAMSTGKPVLLQNVAEQLDPTLTPILNRAIVHEGNQLKIRFNDRLCVYNERFRLFVTTKLSNPHYGPETTVKTTLVNFAVKEAGLEAQLLGIVVRKERPAVEAQKDELVVSIARSRRTLVDLENEIVRMLNENRGSILDDEELFATLQSSQATSATVKEALAVAEVTEVEIDAAREAYRASARRASVLFFVLMDMSLIDPMYQFALDAYVQLFGQSIERSAKATLVAERIVNLNAYHTYAVYKNTCRGLFEVHKLLFSVHICSRVLASANQLNNTEYQFLLNGSVVLDRRDQQLNPCPDWIGATSWDDLCELDRLAGFHGLTDAIEKAPAEWHAWYTTNDPELQPLVGDWQDICNEFQRMLIVRCLRPDRIAACMRTFVTGVLGARFVEPPVLDVRAALEESTCRTPLIFVLSPGVDPTAALMQLADGAKMTKKFHCLSLGQGQAPIATKLVEEGRRNGHWVYLANCHLSLSWMPALDKLVDGLQAKRPHSKFRLWLSSNPTADFPVAILQAGIKMTTEPPKGLRANLQRMYTNLTEDQFDAGAERDNYRKLLFALCFFHSVLLERKKFQQLGFNVAYSFNDADFQVSESLLALYLGEYAETPWDALRYLIAAVNYGGHVTDDWDRRVLTTYINQYFCEAALVQSQFKLSTLGSYFIPRDGRLESYLDYVQLLPGIDRPEAFGQHPNADIAASIAQARFMFERLLSVQMQTGGEADAGGAEERVIQLAADIHAKIPDCIDYANTAKLIGPHRQPLDVVLLQEIERYNVLLRGMRTGLADLQLGLRGLLVMSVELEEIAAAMLEARVPAAWLAAYASLKPLGSWARDLVLRVEHFARWAATSHPPVLFWLAAFTFPTGCLTAVLQTEARRSAVPIDQLAWEFAVSTAAATTTAADDQLAVDAAAQQLQLAGGAGMCVRGLYLEGAGWDRRGQCLREPLPMELVCPMPVVHFRPVDGARRRPGRRVYACPCYYVPQRSGAFVIAVDLQAGSEVSDFWVKRGTALLLSLEN